MSAPMGGLLCVSPGESGRLCECESDPGLPSAMPFMNTHGEAACECHSKHAARYSVTPFPCARAARTEDAS